jgi:hypothetical protein
MVISQAKKSPLVILKKKIFHSLPILSTMSRWIVLTFLHLKKILFESQFHH